MSIGRHGYERNPKTLDEMIHSIEAQLVAMDTDPTFDARTDGVIIHARPMAELFARFAMLERMVAEIPVMVQGMVTAELDRRP